MNKNKKTILFIDDDSDFREAVAFILKSEGFDVISRSDGSELLDYIQNNKPDIAILDYHLPGENGIDLAKKIKENAETIPVILVSSHQDIKEKAYETGVEFFSKPLDFENLISTLNRIAETAD
jgi:two-component system, OmpR family, response regulator